MQRVDDDQRALTYPLELAGFIGGLALASLLYILMNPITDKVNALATTEAQSVDNQTRRQAAVDGANWMALAIDNYLLFAFGVGALGVIVVSVFKRRIGA